MEKTKNKSSKKVKAIVDKSDKIDCKCVKKGDPSPKHACQSYILSNDLSIL